MPFQELTHRTWRLLGNNKITDKLITSMMLLKEKLNDSLDKEIEGHLSLVALMLQLRSIRSSYLHNLMDCSRWLNKFSKLVWTKVPEDSKTSKNLLDNKIKLPKLIIRCCLVVSKTTEQQWRTCLIAARKIKQVQLHQVSSGMRHQQV